MFVEIGLIAGANYLSYRFINSEYIQFKKRFKEFIERIPSLKNNYDETVRLLDYNKTNYGFKLMLELPVGSTPLQLEDNILFIKQGLNLESIYVENNNRNTLLYCIKNYNYKQYKPVKLPPNQVLIGEFIDKYLTVDMNKFPHALICGDTGTGKSRILFTILTNLIYNSNKISIYLLQVRKNDLVIFRNCKQVKSCSRTLAEVLLSLQEIDQELQLRESILDIEKGFLNIDDYNKKSGKTLKYIYGIIEEFSFLNISRADSKDEKTIKLECMRYIKNIVNAGRSSGVFLITSLQKPTNDSIPSDIKSQLTTRIALNILDKSTCTVVMGDNSAVGLDEREFVCKTKGIEKGYSITIGFDEIREYTKSSQVQKQSIVDNALKIKLEGKNTAESILKALGI